MAARVEMGTYDDPLPIRSTVAVYERELYDADTKSARYVYAGDEQAGIIS
jgi:hypothetical protein